MFCKSQKDCFFFFFLKTESLSQWPKIIPFGGVHILSKSLSAVEIQANKELPGWDLPLKGFVCHCLYQRTMRRECVPGSCEAPITQQLCRQKATCAYKGSVLTIADNKGPVTNCRAFIFHSRKYPMQLPPAVSIVEGISKGQNYYYFGSKFYPLWSQSICFLIKS